MTDLRHVARGTLLVLLALPAPLLAQVGTVRTRENLRAEPNGQVIAVLEPGLVLEVMGRREGWLDTQLDGWVWIPSLQEVARADYDVVVSVADGENLRASPSGEIVGRLRRGTLLQARERVPGWIRVSRRGWIWAPSVELETAARAGIAARDPERAVSSFRSVAAAGASILAGPDGDTLARARPGVDLQVLGREGNWARVRVEGWTWLPAGAAAGDTGVVEVTPEQLSAEPERYGGRVVSWELQFLSLERAERIRTDFFEGEPFLLTRDGSGRYVYVALQPERMAEARTLTPLERIAVVGRVRVPASAFTGSPILDLMELVRIADIR